MNTPFTVQQFFEVFTRYNQAVWPMQVVLYLLAAVLIRVAARGGRSSGPRVGAGLAFLWAWMGAVYHWGFFTVVNPVAWIFGALFVVQAILFLLVAIVARRLSFHWRFDAFGVTGAALMTYALVLYPLLGALAGHGYPRGPTFGLPCPTTIFTLGLLLWSEREVPLWVLAVPLGWSILGVSAAASFGIVEDYALPVAGVLSGVMILWKNRDLQSSEAIEAARTPA